MRHGAEEQREGGVQTGSEMRGCSGRQGEALSQIEWGEEVLTVARMTQPCLGTVSILFLPFKPFQTLCNLCSHTLLLRTC